MKQPDNENGNESSLRRRLIGFFMFPIALFPLLALVYSDCLTVPWFGVGSRGGWHIPVTDSGYLYALLTGGTVYIGPGMSPEGVALAKTALEHNARVYDKELVKHEFLGSPRKQRSTFADGTVVTVNFDTDEFSITPGNRKPEI